MLKLEFKEAPGVLLVLAAIAAGVSVLGTHPLDPKTRLSLTTQLSFGALGLVLFITALVLARRPSNTPPPPPTAEYRESFEATQKAIASLTPDHKILADTEIGPTKSKFVVINGDILTASTDVVVSSDDNHFTARGGVAKAILRKAGEPILKELSRVRACQFRQGQIALTSGGEWKCRAIIHAAVIDLDENRYPTSDVIAKLTRRSLDCALAIGAQSIAFPVLGGGTASTYLKPTDSVKALASEVIAFLNRQEPLDALSYVALYIYDADDAAGLPSALKTGATII